MYYFIYKITNKLNNMVYIGVHKTKNIYDGYMGSGTKIREAVEEYGIENFDKEILEFFDNETDMYEKEKYLVNKEFVKDKNSYNVAIGGKGGGFTLEDQKNGWYKHNDALNVKYGANYQNVISRLGVNALEKKYGVNWASKISSMGRIKYNELYPNGSFFGKKHKQETKEKISKKMKINSQGSGNSQYGTMWITNGQINKKIKKEVQIPEGFKKGRVMRV